MRTIEEYIRLAEKAVGSITLPKRPAGLYEPITYGLSNGGKRLRPALLLAACEAAGKDCTAALSQAAAIEMFHNFTLLHDDVMDNADLRRGKPTVCRKWDNNTAILSGDTMLTLATQLLVEGVAPDKAARLLDIFNRAAIGVYEGQQYDMEFESRNDVTEEEYIDMIRLKTSVLLSCSLKMGALLAGASPEDAGHLYDFGIHLGLAFQLKDDLLDVYGNPEVFGKNIGGDILCNKKTYLLIKAYEQATPSQRQALDTWIDAETYVPEEKIASVTALYDGIGVKALCEHLMETYTGRARAALEAVSVPAERKAELEVLMEKLMYREV